MPSKHQPGKEILSKKIRARFLIVVKGYSQKEAGELVGVTQKCISNWSLKHKWKEASDKELMKLGGLRTIMDGFILYVKRTSATEIGNKVETLWNKYLETLQGETETM